MHADMMVSITNENTWANFCVLFRCVRLHTAKEAELEAREHVLLPSEL
jgi:hypothetical protein